MCQCTRQSPFTQRLSLLAKLLLAGMVALVVGPRLAYSGPEVPGARQVHPIALVGGTVHPASGPAIEGGTVLFDGGRLTGIGKDVALPEGTERVEIKGLHVYPGLFDAYTQLGLVEIPSVRGSVDVTETGQINPNVQARHAFNPDSELIPVTRAGGVLTVLAAPAKTLVAGTSSVMQLDGWSPEDMTMRPAAGIHVEWPRTTASYTWRLDDAHEDALKDQDKTFTELRRVLDEARAYWQAKIARQKLRASPSASDARFEALIPLFERKLPLVVHADQQQQIQAAVALAAHEKIDLVIYGGLDAPLCAELLKKFDVPVIAAGVTRLPQRRSDGYDLAYTLPARLHAAGIRFCIAGAGRMGNVRNLPHQAGMAAAHGLPADEALRSITLYPAQILGVADRCGSLEAGKDATLIVTTGDPLEITTQVQRAYIQGRPVDLSNRQTRLWQKYQQKYEQQKASATADK